MKFMFNQDLVDRAQRLDDMGTKILQLQTEMKERRELIDTIFDMLPVLIFWKDRQNRVLGINRYGAELWGATKEQIKGYGWKKLVDNDDIVQQYFDNDMEVITTGQAKLNIIEPLVGDPSRKFLTHKMPLIHNGKIEGIIGFSIEVTQLCKESTNG